MRGRDSFSKGGKTTLAISRQRKEDLLKQYDGWLGRTQAMIVTEYVGMNMKDVDALRAKVREVGGEFHIVKNTLGRKVLAAAGYSVPKGLMEGSTAIVFAFKDAPAVAKAITDYARTSERLKIKGGFLGKNALTPEAVRSLADMPPLPVMRAQLLGMLSAPASKLVRTLAEPGRSVAAVIKAYADRDTASAAA